MPSIHLPIGPQGAVLLVGVGVSKPRQDALKLAGHTVPPMVSGQFLLDTGASTTCIDPNLISSLGIPQTGVVSIQTPSTNGAPHSCGQYDVMLLIPGMDQSKPGLHIDAIPIIETPLSTQGISGLIGRDVLDRCVLVYNPEINFFTLSY